MTMCRSPIVYSWLTFVFLRISDNFCCNLPAGSAWGLDGLNVACCAFACVVARATDAREFHATIEWGSTFRIWQTAAAVEGDKEAPTGNEGRRSTERGPDAAGERKRHSTYFDKKTAYFSFAVMRVRSCAIFFPFCECTTGIGVYLACMSLARDRTHDEHDGKTIDLWVRYFSSGNALSRRMALHPLPVHVLYKSTTRIARRVGGAKPISHMNAKMTSSAVAAANTPSSSSTI